MKWPKSEQTHKLTEVCGFGAAIFQTKIRSRSREKSDALENAPGSSETMVTPLHGLELGQAGGKSFKCQKPYKQHKVMYFKQLIFIFRNIPCL